SIVAGRHGIPTSGGGGLAVVNGKINFEAMTLHFPQSSLDLGGGLKIGLWQPDFDIHLRSRDLAEVDNLFQNFVAATGQEPEPIGLGGSGEVQGHVAGTWADPDASVQVSAEQARFAGVPFGSVRGTVDMREGAFFFRPLRVYDGDASLSLEGMARYRQDPRLPKLDLSVAARDYPLSRLLAYLQLDYPIEGKLTGSFPIAGNPEALTGGGAMRLSDATAWDQKFPLITARALFTPGRFAVEDLRAQVGGGMIGGSAAIAFNAKTFEARLAGDAIPLEAIQVFQSAARDVTGVLSFQLSGGGSLDRPDVKLSASLSHASFFGHPIADTREPRVEATVSRGLLEGSVTVPDHWSFTARGDLFGEPPRVDVALDAADLNAFLLFTPLDVAPGRGGSLAVNGNLTIPRKKGESASGTFTVTRARLDMPDRPGVLATRGQVRIALAGGKLTFDEFEAAGEGTALKVSGSIGLTPEAGGLALAVKGPIDASLVSLLLPDTVVSGKLTADVRASGTLQKPSLLGSVRIEKGKYRLTGLAQIVDDVDANITFQGLRADLDARARVGGGDAYASGSFSFQAYTLQDFRIAMQLRHVALRYPQDLRLVVDADLVASGGPGNSIIRGEVLLLRGTYSKDFEVTLSDLVSRTRPSSAVASREPWKERTALEVRIVSSAALEVRNNLVRLTLTVDLVARGTVANPTLLGQILLDEGGRITFRDVRYEIESGTIAFANREGFTPIIDIRARADNIKGYTLIVSLVGTWPRIQTSFSSDPPLPDETIVGLLLTGSEPGARATTDTSGQIVSAAGGIVAGAVTSPLTRRTQRFFKLDRFEIDPVFSGTQGQTVDVRSTVGKQITPNLLVTYSQSFDTAKEPLFKLEWRISDTIVLQGRRDENGIYLIDIRRRQRF
ncbi:MAG TPA: translocation/assembly module TamB domain-containing protein, partial [Thermoanaerobaculia bacterium]|nr:translocation/assembly module TamB domain-containing protein [Thermoanaerobaculia bacterium]